MLDGLGFQVRGCAESGFTGFGLRADVVERSVLRRHTSLLPQNRATDFGGPDKRVMLQQSGGLILGFGCTAGVANWV